MEDNMRKAFQRGTARAAFIVPFAALLCIPFPASANGILASAQSFAVLGASTVTNTGPTTITGDLGLSPGTSITGFLAIDGGPGLVIGGTIHKTDGVAGTAQTDVTAAYNELASRSATTTYGSGQELGGLTLNQGIYVITGSAQLTGTLVLDALND